MFSLTTFLVHVESNELEHIKNSIKAVSDEFDGVDSLCSERWGMWDLVNWCSDNDIGYEMVYPNPEKQKSAFGELYHLYNTGRIKIPTLGVPGSRGEDILEEEALLFEYNLSYKDNFSSKKKALFGSPEKFKRYGVQDDALYSLAWAIYGGRELGFDDLRDIAGATWFGNVYSQDELE